LPSFITASADFYRVDTALSVPQLSHRDWRLRIHGMVDHEATYSFDDLAYFDVVEMVTTLACVSNPVGGRLISTGVWTGYGVADRRAERWSEGADGVRSVWRCRVGTESWRAGRGGPHRRWRMAAC